MSDPIEIKGKKKEGKPCVGCCDHIPDDGKKVDAQPELKPCPFCDKPVRRGSEESEGHLNAFYCANCDADFSFMWDGKRETYDRAFNTRPAPEVIASMWIIVHDTGAWFDDRMFYAQSSAEEFMRECRADEMGCKAIPVTISRARG